MYEDLPAEKTTEEFGSVIAAGLGYVDSRMIFAGQSKVWIKPHANVGKHQYFPMIQAWHGLLKITGLTWAVSWYLHDGHLDGVRIVGYPDETMGRILALAGSEGLKAGYERQLSWLGRNSLYHESPPGPKSSTRSQPKDYLIA